MNTVLNARAACPFYKHDTPAKKHDFALIACEGIYGTATKTLFKKQRDKDAHAEQYCISIQGCKQCEIYKTLEKKYKS